MFFQDQEKRVDPSKKQETKYECVLGKNTLQAKIISGTDEQDYSSI